MIYLCSERQLDYHSAVSFGCHVASPSRPVKIIVDHQVVRRPEFDGYNHFKHYGVRLNVGFYSS